MSAIYFHSPGEQATVDGTERHRFSGLCYRFFFAALNLGIDSGLRPHPLRLVFPADHYTSRHYGREWATDVETTIIAQGFSVSEPLVIGDRRTSLLTAALNTALAIGGDSLKLAARLHGQCEIHAFVEGANREWLADIVEKGLRSGIFHTNVGWSGVIQLLRSSSKEPVVTSHSSSGQFPDPVIAVEEGMWSPPEIVDPRPDPWEDLPAVEQWKRAMKALRMRNGTGFRVELNPDDWEEFHFEEGVAAFDVMEHFSSMALSRFG